MGVDDIFSLDVDILAPCALGGALNDATIPKINANIICGGANNQLLDAETHGETLQNRDILFVPDYVANAGGAISGAAEVANWSPDKTQKLIENIYTNCMKIFEITQKDMCTPSHAAEKLAKEILT